MDQWDEDRYPPEALKLMDAEMPRPAAPERERTESADEKPSYQDARLVREAQRQRAAYVPTAVIARDNGLPFHHSKLEAQAALSKAKEKTR